MGHGGRGIGPAVTSRIAMRMQCYGQLICGPGRHAETAWFTLRLVQCMQPTFKFHLLGTA